jgi:hypothetical protein
MAKGFGLGHPLKMPKYYSNQMLKQEMAQRRKIKNQDLDGDNTIANTNNNAIRRFIPDNALKSPIGMLSKEDAQALITKIKEIASSFVGIKAMSQTERSEIIKTSCKYFSDYPHKIKSIDSIMSPIFRDLDNQIQNKENQSLDSSLSFRDTLLKLKSAQRRVRFQPTETESKPDVPLNPDSKPSKQPRLL